MFQDIVMYFFGEISGNVAKNPTEIIKANPKKINNKIWESCKRRLKRQASWRSGLRSGLLAKEVSEVRGPNMGLRHR